MEKKPQLVAKEQAVSALREHIRDNAATLLIDYKGITVAEDTEFRRILREADVTYYVARNTLIKRAANDEGITALDPLLEGTTAVSFAQDPVALAKLVSKFAKDHSSVKVKGGVIDGKLLPADRVIELSKLPPKEVLLAQVLGAMQSPMAGFAGALQGVLGNFARVLNQVYEQKAAQ